MKHSAHPICGIYKVTNKINNKVYIGKSTDIYYRWKEHIRNKDKKDFQYVFARALRKYGETNFSWEIVERCNETVLNDKEIFYIKKFNSFIGEKGSWGYNMTRGGDGQSGVGIVVYQYSLKGEYIGQFESVASASINTGTNASGIINCCAHRRKSSGGFIWSYEKKENISPYTHNNNVPVAQYTKDGEFIKFFETVTEAAKSVSRTKTQITMCCRNKTPSCGGYIWRYVK